MGRVLLCLSVCAGNHEHGTVNKHLTKQCIWLSVISVVKMLTNADYAEYFLK